MIRTIALLGSIVVVAAVLAVVVEELTVHPSLLALLRTDYLSTHGQAPMLFSVELYTDVGYFESARGSDGPLAMRILDPGGNVVVQRPTRRLDPNVNEGVCVGERPAIGQTWWSSAVPPDLAADLRLGGTTRYRFEGEFDIGYWVPVTLIDSGCRGVGRG